MADHQLNGSGAVPNNNSHDHEDDEMVNAKEVMESLLAELRKDREMGHAKEVMKLLLVERRKDREMGHAELLLVERRKDRDERCALIYAALLAIVCALIYWFIIRGE
jgi:hypothetical protein